MFRSSGETAHLEEKATHIYTQKIGLQPNNPGRNLRCSLPYHKNALSTRRSPLTYGAAGFQAQRGHRQMPSMRSVGETVSQKGYVNERA